MTVNPPGLLQLVERPPDRDQADPGLLGQFGVAGQQITGDKPALGDKLLDQSDDPLVKQCGSGQARRGAPGAVACQPGVARPGVS